jgi:hypothetical protein
MTYTLLDGVRQHEAHPDTFAIPDQETVLLLGKVAEKAAEKKDTVRVLVKLCFLAEGGGERMWVVVTHNGGEGEWEGRLSCTAIYEGMPEPGEIVRFTWRNVIDFFVEGLS